MPDIQPSAGDSIQIELNPPYSSPTIMMGKIMTKDQSGKYQVELNGTPTMRGLVSISEYSWDHKSSRWIRKIEEKKAPTKLNMLAVGSGIESLDIKPCGT